MPTSAAAVRRAKIDPDTSIGTVALTVSDAKRSCDFYERTVGLRATQGHGGAISLGAPGEPPLIELYEDRSAASLNRRATGLYHLAILLPSRYDLALALARLIDSRWPLDGAADHLVSEALYLSDPDGNGIELYRDRPREHWQRTQGALQMATLPLDLEELLGELANENGDGDSVASPPKIGHVHLQVAELEAAEWFYSGVLGFEVTVREYPGALFLAAGGYHHHVGLNTWHSAGAAPPSPGSIGLRTFEVQLPSSAELAQVLARVSAAGLQSETVNGATVVRDPSGIGVLLQAR